MLSTPQGMKLKGVIGIGIIAVGFLFVIDGWKAMYFSDSVLAFPLSPLPESKNLNSEFNIIPKYIYWLDALQVTRNPDIDVYRIHQNIHFQFYFSSTIKTNEAVMHIYHSDLKEIFSTAIENNYTDLPRFYNERVFHYDFDSPLSSCTNQTNQSNCTFNYNGNINHNFTIPGTYYVDFSLRKGNTLYQYNDPIPLLRVIDPTDDWMINSTSYILGQAYKQPFEKYGSDGLAVVGIGAGIVLSGVPFVTGYVEELTGRKKTKSFVTDDFKLINNLIVELSNNLNTSLKNMEGENKYVNALLSHKASTTSLLGTYYRKLRLYLWESVSNHLREFSNDEQITLRKLHDFVEDANEVIIYHYHSLSEKLNSILNSSDTDSNKITAMTKALQIQFKISLQEYEKLYSRIHNELNKIDWVDRSDWNKFPQNEE